MTAGVERFDAVVVGATIRGVVATYVLDSLGYRSALVDRRPVAGGADSSFTASDGSVFEYGMHVLDEMRSPLATRLFSRAVDGRICRTRLERAIVLRGQLMPYAPWPAQMPDELRNLLAAEEFVDDIGDAPPTRSALARIYGAGFADLIFDEVLPSFPSEARHLEFGVDESRLLTNIYPWFFPRGERAGKTGDASRAFHDLLRSGEPQHVLYPRQGGFGAFASGFIEHCDTRRTSVYLGAGDIDVEIDRESQSIASVKVDGRRFQARHYFWGDAWPALCALIGLPCQQPATDRIVLGSFCFDRPIECRYHEVLVGDPRFAINRLYFPGAFCGRRESRLQIEFAFPAAEENERGLEADAWKQRWLADLAALGLVDEHSVTMFDFKSRRIHFNAFGMEGEPLVDADPALVDVRSNIRPLAPSMANLNLNTHVPATVAAVTQALAADGPWAGARALVDD